MSGTVEVTVRGVTTGYTNQVDARDHRLLADEPRDLNGNDEGPSPYEYLLGALGACTSMTIAMYAQRKGYPPVDVRVRLTHRKADASEVSGDPAATGKLDVIEREIGLHGPLDDEQRQKLLEIANKCPVHRTLSSAPIAIRSRLG
jgi:putative redox protein